MTAGTARVIARAWGLIRRRGECREPNQISRQPRRQIRPRQILVFLTGVQAVVRMLLMQRERDRRAGLNTAGFVSGYRGSPLGGLDLQLARVEASCSRPRHRLPARPQRGAGRHRLLGLAAGRNARRRHVMTASSASGTARGRASTAPATCSATPISPAPRPHGGVLALMGDDHTAESSTTAHPTEFHFVDVMIPILNPAGVQEILDYGLYGYAHVPLLPAPGSAIKCVKDNIESTASVDGSLERVKIVIPESSTCRPAASTSAARRCDPRPGRAAAGATSATPCSPSSRANELNRIVYSGGPNAKIGIITVGKSYLDVRQALDDLGIDEVQRQRSRHAALQGRLPVAARSSSMIGFARGLDMVIVVEEKRSLIEVQLREELYGTAEPARSASARRTSAATGCSRSRARSTRTTSPSRSASACCAIAPATTSRRGWRG